MKNLFTVMQFTIKEAVQKKSFIITNIILVVLIVLSFNISNILNMFGTEESVKEIVFVDESNIIKTSGLKAIDEYKLTIDNETPIEELARRVEEGEISSVVKINNDNNAISFDYIVKNYGNGLSPDVIQFFIEKINDNKLLLDANVSPDIINAINTPVTYELKKSSDMSGDISGSSMISILASLLLFMGIYYFAYSVCLSISAEKSSRVMETLITSTSPKAIVLGKTIGMGLLGLAQVLELVIVAVISSKIFGNGIEFLGTGIDFSMLTPGIIAIAIIYFVLGYILYAMMYAVVGASISRQEELQSAATPVSLISLIAFYAGYFSTIISPGGNLSVICSLVPFSSPFTMFSRMLCENVPTNEIVISLLLLVVGIVVISAISIKIYSNAVLHYGNKLKLKDFLHMIKKA